MKISSVSSSGISFGNFFEFHPEILSLGLFYSAILLNSSFKIFFLNLPRNHTLSDVISCISPAVSCRISLRVYCLLMDASQDSSPVVIQRIFRLVSRVPRRVSPAVPFGIFFIGFPELLTLDFQEFFLGFHQSRDIFQISFWIAFSVAISFFLEVLHEI